MGKKFKESMLVEDGANGVFVTSNEVISEILEVASAALSKKAKNIREGDNPTSTEEIRVSYSTDTLLIKGGEEISQIRDIVSNFYLCGKWVSGNDFQISIYAHIPAH